MMSTTAFRGTRNRTRSARGRRLTPAEKIERFNECKHAKFRYRKRGTEAVCLNCEAVQTLRGNNVASIEVIVGWRLMQEEEEA